MITINFELPATGEASILAHLQNQPDVDGRFTPYQLDSGVQAYLITPEVPAMVTLTNPITFVSQDVGAVKVTLTAAENASITKNAMVILYDYWAETPFSPMMATYIMLSKSLASIKSDTEWTKKVRKNENTVVKIGDSYYDIVYDDNGSTELVKRKLKTFDDTDIGTLVGTTFPSTAEKSTV